MMIKSVRPKLEGLNAVVIGRSQLVGKPMGQLLLQENCTVTMAHSKTRDLAHIARTADVLVAAVGRAEMVKGDWIKPGAVVIDVGMNRIELPGGKSKLFGDVAYNEAKAHAAAITPVPGGVGPMTRACLLRNTVSPLARKREFVRPRSFSRMSTLPPCGSTTSTFRLKTRKSWRSGTPSASASSARARTSSAPASRSSSPRARRSTPATRFHFGFRVETKSNVEAWAEALGVSIAFDEDDFFAARVQDPDGNIFEVYWDKY